MNTLEKLHLDSIQTNKEVRKQLCVNDFGTSGLERQVSTTAAGITKNIAIEFAKWCDDRDLSNNHMSWEDFFEEFLKTLK